MRVRATALTLALQHRSPEKNNGEAGGWAAGPRVCPRARGHNRSPQTRPVAHARLQDQRRDHGSRPAARPQGWAPRRAHPAPGREPTGCRHSPAVGAASQPAAALRAGAWATTCRELLRHHCSPAVPAPCSQRPACLGSPVPLPSAPCSAGYRAPRQQAVGRCLQRSPFPPPRDAQTQHTLGAPSRGRAARLHGHRALPGPIPQRSQRPSPSCACCQRGWGLAAPGRGRGARGCSGRSGSRRGQGAVPQCQNRAACPGACASWECFGDGR